MAKNGIFGGIDVGQIYPNGQLKQKQGLNEKPFIFQLFPLSHH
jgi:hypothetical protein